MRLLGCPYDTEHGQVPEQIYKTYNKATKVCTCGLAASVRCDSNRCWRSGCSRALSHVSAASNMHTKKASSVILAYFRCEEVHAGEDDHMSAGAPGGGIESSATLHARTKHSHLERTQATCRNASSSLAALCQPDLRTTRPQRQGRELNTTSSSAPISSTSVLQAHKVRMKLVWSGSGR